MARSACDAGAHALALSPGSAWAATLPEMGSNAQVLGPERVPVSGLDKLAFEHGCGAVKRQAQLFPLAHASSTRCTTRAAS